MEEETIAKKDREVAESTDESTSTDMLDSERPEMPEDMEEMGEMGGGPMGGDFPGEMTTTATTETNEWLAPMVGAGITSGVVVIATAIICFMIYRLGKKLKN